MTDFLLILGLAVLSNVFVTLFILHRYTIGLTEVISKSFDNILDATKSTMYATFEVKSKILNELDKLDEYEPKERDLTTTKRTIEIDLDTIAEEVSNVIAHKLGLEKKGKELSKKSNLLLLRSLKEEDFTNELTARYVDKANSSFEVFGKSIEELGVKIKND